MEVSAVSERNIISDIPSRLDPINGVVVESQTRNGSEGKPENEEYQDTPSEMEDDVYHHSPLPLCVTISSDRLHKQLHEIINNIEDKDHNNSLSSYSSNNEQEMHDSNVNTTCSKVENSSITTNCTKQAHSSNSAKIQIDDTRPPQSNPFPLLLPKTETVSG